MKPQILTTLPSYRAESLRADIFAGLSVAMVALPLSLAIAIASGAAPEKGLITAIVAGFLISALGGSRVQVGGPTGAFIVVVAGIIAAHGYSGLVTATFMAGILLLIGAVLRLGALIRHVPEPFINGFTAGIAVIIAVSQLPDLLGLSLPSAPAETLPKLLAIWQARAELSFPALGVGAGAMLLILWLRHRAPKLPALILAVAAVSALAWALSLPIDTIESRFGALPRHLPDPKLPQISLGLMIELLPSALLIAFLAGVESLLSAMVADRMISDRHRPNAELMAQGAANLASSLFGGLPATGAIARTATNVRAGARTPVAGMVHAIAVLAMMMLAAPLVGQMAMPALAGLLILTAWTMAEVPKWGFWLSHGPLADRALLVLTLVLTVLADLTIAIGSGVAIGLLLSFLRGRRRA